MLHMQYQGKDLSSAVLMNVEECVSGHMKYTIRGHKAGAKR